LGKNLIPKAYCFGGLIRKENSETLIPANASRNLHGLLLLNLSEYCTAVNKNFPIRTEHGAVSAGWHLQAA
jgi:hypothetical protein